MRPGNEAGSTPLTDHTLHDQPQWSANSLERQLQMNNFFLEWKLIMAISWNFAKW